MRSFNGYRLNVLVQTKRLAMARWPSKLDRMSMLLESSCLDKAFDNASLAE